MRTLGFVLLGLASLDVLMLALLLGTVWFAHRAVRREAAAKGEHVPSAASDFRCLFAVLGALALGLGAASLALLTV
ncbi:MAG: hypothetical protein J0I06_06445 [Planctomycetes bacterium]|nr:hypothetical protein [Planctomycetota bacterium]